MLYILVFVLFGSGARAESGHCPVQLEAGVVIPVIEVETVGTSQLRPSDRYDWRKLFGRTILVRQLEDGVVGATLRQSFVTRAQLIRTYPEAGAAVRSINTVFDQANRKFRGEHRDSADRRAARAQGLDEEFGWIEAMFPGELGVLVLALPEEVHYSTMMVSLDQNADLDLPGRLLHLDLGAAVRELYRPMFDYLKNTERGRRNFRVIMVHNHPGLVAPLSRADLNFAEGLSRFLYRRQAAWGDWEVVMVALASLDRTGDVAFVRRFVNGGDAP